MQLAEEAIHVERDLIGESVGSQDQVSAAFGGFNRISFTQDDKIQVQPVIIGRERLETLQSHLMLYFTGFSRFASTIAETQIKNTPKKKPELRTMHAMVDEAIKILVGGG